MCIALRLAQVEGEMLGISSACLLLQLRVPELSLSLSEEAETEQGNGETLLLCLLLKCSSHIFLLAGGGRNLYLEGFSQHASGSGGWCSQVDVWFTGDPPYTQAHNLPFLDWITMGPGNCSRDSHLARGQGRITYPKLSYFPAPLLLLPR